MDDIITVRVKNVLGTEEATIQVRTNATVSQLLGHAASQSKLILKQP